MHPGMHTCVCSLTHTYTKYSSTFHLNLQNPYNIKQRYGNSKISASRRQLLSLTRICLTYSHLFTSSHLSGINTCIRRYAATHLLLQYHLITVPQRKKEEVSSLLYLGTHWTHWKNWPHWTLLLPWQPFFSFFLSLFLSFPPSYWFLFFCFTGFLPSPQCAVYNTLTDFHTFSFLLDCFHFHCCQIPHLSPYRFSLTSFCPFLLTSSL